MKNRLLLLMGFICVGSYLWAQNVGIGKTNPHESAVLDISVSDKGLLIPRLTTTQRNAIPSPATGLMLFNTTTKAFNIYSGTQWITINSTEVSTSTGTISPGGGVSVNITGNAPSSVAALDVSSSEKGFLLPRTSTSAVNNPAEGLVIFNNSAGNIAFYNGTTWLEPCFTAAGNTTGTGSLSSGSVVIGGNISDASAMLDVIATDKGLRLPMLTSATRNNLNAEEGLMLYNTTTATIDYWNGSAWHRMETGAPAIPGTISGNTTVCTGQTGVSYSIGPVSGATNYVWSVPVGSSIVSGQGSNSIIVNFGSNSGNISVYTENACGSSTPQTIAISLNTAPTSVTAAASPNPICAGNTLTLTGGATGATSWSWTGPSSYTASTQNASRTNVTTAHAGVYTLTATNSCGSTQASTASVVVNTAPAITVQPVAPTAVCAGNGTRTISVTVTGAGLTYQWRRNSVNISNTAPYSGVTTNTLTITNPAADIAGSFDVVISGTCTPSVTSNAVTLTVNTTPTSVTAVASPNPICAGNTLTLTGEATGATSWSWTGPSSYTASTQNASRTNVTTAHAGVYTLTASNSCGSASAVNTASVTVNSAPAQPGTISGLTSVCASQSGITYSVGAVSGATSYTWSLPSGWSGSSSTNSIIVTSGTAGGTISVTANNDCGSSSARTLAVSIEAIWGQTQSLTGGHSGYGIAVDASGVYASGFHTPTTSNAAWYVQKRNLTSGVLITDATTQPSTSQDIAQRIFSNGTSLFIAGRQANATNWRMESRSTTNLSTINYNVTSTPNTTTNDIHDAVIDDTHMYIVGFDQQAVGNTRWRIEKRNLSNGTLAATWTRDFTANSARPDIAYGVAVDATSIYVVGGSDGSVAANNDGIWRMVKINKNTGADQWSISFNPTVFSSAGGGGGSSEPALDVAVDATGVYVVGFSIGNPQNYQLIIQKRSLTDGSLIWTQSISTSSIVIGNSYANLAIDATGLYVTGLQSGLWNVTKLNLTNGNVICTSSATGGTRASDIAVGSDGSIYVVGSVTNQFRVEKMCCQ